MRYAVALTALLAILPLAALAETKDSPPSTANGEYTIVVRTYASGELQGDMYCGPFSKSGDYELNQICSAEGGEGSTALMPVCYLLMLSPLAQQKLRGSMEGRMRETLKGLAQPPLRELRFAGWRMYYYFPRADYIQLTLVRHAPGAFVIADGDWGSPFLGEVVEQLGISQPLEERDE